MSEMKIAEFRERAEHGLDWPELARIEQRGRARRRRKVVAAVGGLALAAVAGAGVVDRVADPSGSSDSAPVPAGSTSPDPVSTVQPGLRTTLDRGEDVLLPGRSKVDYDGIEVAFDAPSKSWEWWGAGLGLRRGANPDNYAAAIFFLPDSSARVQACAAHDVQPLGADPDNLVANVAPLLDLARSRVLQPPQVVTAFGTTAVHARLETDGFCPDHRALPIQLRGVVGGQYVDPGFGRHRTLDVWHLVVPGTAPRTVTVASWDLGATSAQRLEQQALLDSLRIAPRT